MTDKTHHHTNRTLVLGATGKTGRRVAERLRTLDVPVHPGSRSGTPPFDWDDPGTWAAAVEGIDAVYVTYQPDLALPGADSQIAAFTRLAVRAGARHLVLLSGRGEPGALASEDAFCAAASTAAWTIVRSSWFSQNFSEAFLLGPVLGGRLELPAGDVAEPFVDADDIADVVVAALTQPGHDGRVYEVTGPELLTLAEVAATIADASGRDVVYEPVDSERFAATLRAAGLPEDDAAGLSAMLTELFDGRNAHLSDGIRQALGREPRSFADYARRAAATGVWDVPAPAPA